MSPFAPCTPDCGNSKRSAVGQDSSKRRKPAFNTWCLYTPRMTQSPSFVCSAGGLVICTCACTGAEAARSASSASSASRSFFRPSAVVIVLNILVMKSPVGVLVRGPIVPSALKFSNFSPTWRAGRRIKSTLRIVVFAACARSSSNLAAMRCKPALVISRCTSSCSWNALSSSSVGLFPLVSLENGPRGFERFFATSSACAIAVFNSSASRTQERRSSSRNLVASLNSIDASTRRDR
mmetsp:Transcript_68707/g.199326  ORF Transcript_68707/g.199326 Transcript_68707/m.199326 type:complete len:237 (+) Transcript_68707:550-1260(+)